jgi:hypothetical protein
VSWSVAAGGRSLEWDLFEAGRVDEVVEAARSVALDLVGSVAVAVAVVNAPRGVGEEAVAG